MYPTCRSDVRIVELGPPKRLACNVGHAVSQAEQQGNGNRGGALHVARLVVSAFTAHVSEVEVGALWQLLAPRRACLQILHVVPFW